MTTDLSIRQYRPVDRERVVDVRERALRDADAYFEDVPDEYEGTDIETAFLESRGEYLVVEVEGEIVATGGVRPPAGVLAERLDPGPGVAELKNMHVLPAYQRRGYGTRILTELLDRARELDYETLALTTSSRQEAAQAFYEAHGFDIVRCDRIEAFEEPFDLLFYTRSLSDR